MFLFNFIGSSSLSVQPEWMVCIESPKYSINKQQLWDGIIEQSIDWLSIWMKWSLLYLGGSVFFSWENMLKFW